MIKKTNKRGGCQKLGYKNADILYLKDITFNNLMLSIHTHKYTKKALHKKH